MFDTYKIKVTDTSIKVYADGILGKELLFEATEEIIGSMKLGKEVKLAIREAIVKQQVKKAMKAKPTGKAKKEGFN